MAIARQILEGKLDFGFTGGQAVSDALEMFPVAELPMAVVAHVTSPLAALNEITWDELFDHPLILFPEGYRQRRVLDQVALKIGRRPKIVIESESIGFATAMVRAGRGVSLVLADISHKLPGMLQIPFAPPLPEGLTVTVTLCRLGDGCLAPG